MISYKELTEIGFSSKEAKVYLASLELGPSTATQISRKAKINRTTSYDILESLAGNGLVNLLAQAKVQKFSAESPQKVLNFLENKIKEGQEKLSAAYALVPQLLSVYNTKEKPKVRFYEGIDGVREAFEDTLTAKEEIRMYADGGNISDVFPKEYFSAHFKKRAEKNIGTRVIAPDTLESRMVVANDKKEMRASILVPRDKFYFSVETNIYDNKIMIASWCERFAVIIESEEIADAQKKTFELAWEGAKKFSVS